MQQQMSVITLGVSDLARSKRFYGNGFGWTPIFENSELAFYQMNGFVLRTWLQVGSRPTCGVAACVVPVPSRSRTTLHRKAKFRSSSTVWNRQEGAFFAMATRRLTADSVAMSPTPMITPGRSPGTRPGRLTAKAW